MSLTITAMARAIVLEAEANIGPGATPDAVANEAMAIIARGRDHKASHLPLLEAESILTRKLEAAT